MRHLGTTAHDEAVENAVAKPFARKQKRPGKLTRDIASFGLVARDRFRNNSCNDFRRRQSPWFFVAVTQAPCNMFAKLFVGTCAGYLLYVVSSDATPGSLYSTGFNDNDIDTELL